MTEVRLEGVVYPTVDCQGCDTAPRRYSGRAVVSLPDSTGPAIVAWLPQPARFDPPCALPKRAWTVDGERITIRIPDAGGGTQEVSLDRELDWGSGAPIAIRAAYLTAFPDLALRLLVVETNGNSACERGLFLFQLHDGAVRRLGGTDFDCDV
ncbi:hypothetical protein [Anaeromyxobacter oryzae]|uniref:Lipoprotein n=1 Tax=Anaeromyxobacter oryzae TaxID=2918170 RepID=A0ABM7X3D5_9BACT|nr:hypothetical protein [Anaeromyxobacter oryzae]BDG06309.1 hypothetical protein AMOR_53050 [Anaeromyxobacter oryzae]